MQGYPRTRRRPFAVVLRCGREVSSVEVVLLGPEWEEEMGGEGRGGEGRRWEGRGGEGRGGEGL